MRKAIVLGATGLTGKALVQQLLADEHYSSIKVLTRRTIGIEHPKLIEVLVNFRDPANWQHEVSGDVLFSAFGTTLKKGGSKTAQFEIDYTYQLAVAKAASANGVPQIVLISSNGANAKSPIFYLQMKGQLEQALVNLDFASLHFLRPGPIIGKREEERAGEKIGAGFIRFLNGLGLLRHLKPITGEQLAKAMRLTALEERMGVYTYESGQIWQLLTQHI